MGAAASGLGRVARWRFRALGRVNDRTRRLWALLIAVWVGAIAGLVLDASRFTGGDGTQAVPAPPPAPAGTYAIGDRVPAAFGSLSVDNVVRMVGRPDAVGVPMSP